ncbi:MAG: hypothetical protein WD073_05835, partial [Xanthobacteraceae bacterium]
MQRIMVTALVASVAGTFSAVAQPMQLSPYYYSAPPPYAAAPPPQYMQPAPPPPQYAPHYAPQAAVAPPVEPPGPDLGGGFIEFVFSG